MLSTVLDVVVNFAAHYWAAITTNYIPHLVTFVLGWNLLPQPEWYGKTWHKFLRFIGVEKKDDAPTA